MRNGQPKKIRQPIIITKPRTKRVKGEEPAVALNSLFAKAITQAPTMIPMISGRRYCTVSLVCSFIAPAVSRTKQAMQIAMLPGLPLDASMMATAAATTPHTTRITRSLVSEFTQVSFIEGERGKTANTALGGMAQFARHNRKPTTRAGVQKRWHLEQNQAQQRPDRATTANTSWSAHRQKTAEHHAFAALIIPIDVRLSRELFTSVPQIAH